MRNLIVAAMARHDKNRQHKQLCDFERRLGLCRRKRMQRRNFFKCLHHCDKKIEVETNHAADDVDPAPRPCEMLRVTRKNRKCEERQRYDAETDGRRETMKREKESRDRRREGCDEKPFRPAIRRLPASNPNTTTKPVKIATRLIRV